MSPLKCNAPAFPRQWWALDCTHLCSAERDHDVGKEGLAQSPAVLAGVCFSQLQQYRCSQVILETHSQATDIPRRLFQNLEWELCLCFTWSFPGIASGSLGCVRKEFISLRKENWLLFLNPIRETGKLWFRELIFFFLLLCRWWPAEICNPRSVPLNIQGLKHDIGDFPVFFFGSHDYYWVHQGRVFPYVEGDKSFAEGQTSINKTFKKGKIKQSL